MSIKKEQKTRGIILRPDDVALEGIEGEIKVGSTSKEIEAYLDGSARTVVTEDQSQILTNKDINADNNSISELEVDNLKSGVLNIDLEAGPATDLEIPSALAVQTLVATSSSDADAALQAHINDVVDAHDASAISSVPAGTIAATDVQSAINELDTDIQAHINDATDAHDASAISNIPAGTIAATDVQSAINELDGDIQAHIADTVDAHDASAISFAPAGTIAATDVQTAIAEVATDAASALTAHEADTSTHGVGVIVGTTEVQTLTNKIITGADFRTPVRSDVKQDTYANLLTYALTASNGQLCFATDTKLMYQIVDSLLVDVGSGGGTTDPDVMFAQNFDDAALADFTQTGLALNTADSLHGDASAKLTHDPSVNQSFAQTVAVDPKFRGVSITASMLVKSTATDGNLTFTAYDVTNATTLSSQSIGTSSQTIATLTTTNSSTTVSGFTSANINTLSVGMSVTGTGIQAGTEISAVSATANTITLSAAANASGTVSLQFSALPKTVQLGFTIPANCASISYTITALPQAGAPETYIDDIVFRNYWQGSAVEGQTAYTFTVPVITEWASYTPTFTGFGTVSTQSFMWRQNGSNVEIHGRFTTGTTTATEARISLPNSYTSAATISTLEIAGTAGRNAAQAATFYALMEPSVGYFTFSAQAAASNILAKLNGNSFGTGDIIPITVSIPIANLSATTSRSVVTTDLVPARSMPANATIEVPNVTSWASYTPTFTGFGTATSIEFQWRQNGQDVEIRGKFVSGTSTATEARITLPSGYTSSATSVIPSIGIIGSYARNASSTDKGGMVLIEPSVGYVTFGSVATFGASSTSAALSKVNGNDLISSGTTLSFTAKVPVASLTATTTKTWSATQAVTTQAPDSYVRVTTLNGYGSTATKIRRFTTLSDSLGSDILYTDSATNGASFTVQTAGVYTISYDDSFTTATYIGLSKNASSLTTGIDATSVTERIAITYQDAINTICTISTSVYLNVGDIIRPHTSGGIASVTGAGSFKITKQGSLSLVQSVSDQKIAIPTSELRFEGASARGAVATAIVKFDSVAKIRGDAFTVTNTTNDGTYVTMTKAGKLDIDSAFILPTAGQVMQITKNQVTLTSTSATTSEILNTDQAYGSPAVTTVGWSGFVNVGDIIRIAASGTPSSNANNLFNLSFQEQRVSVSVTNVLPQFSDSDSSVRLYTANGYGSTATKIRRLSNIVDNLGTAITYNPNSDEATNGASFRVNESGIYSVSYAEAFDSAAYLGLTKNSTSLTTNINSLAAPEVLAVEYNPTNTAAASVAWEGYLRQGDIIRPHTDGVANTGGTGKTMFTMSKVGKPNVTGVDVTPFVNIPLSETETIEALTTTSTFGGTNTGVPVLNITKNTNKGIISVSSSAAAGTSFTALKACKLNISANASTTTTGSVFITRNATILTAAAPDGAVQGSTCAGSSADSVSVEIVCSVGDVIRVQRNTTNLANIDRVVVTATAESASLLTPISTFSTDTASLTYAGSATYTLATLADAPVGTFITYTYAINSNTRTQTTTAPTQTTSDMNTNGILLYTRAFNAASTAAQPTTVAIQIGKGMKGKDLQVFKSASKTTAGDVDYYLRNTTTDAGIPQKIYDEKTGILLIDIGGPSKVSTITTSDLYFNDATTQTSGYLVINASKNPALTGVPVLQPRIATISDQKTSGTAGGSTVATTWTDRVLNTLVDNTGIVTSLASNQFTLPAGEYYFEFASPCYLTNGYKTRIRNITDGTTVVVGNNGFAGNGDATASTSIGKGSVVISSAKTFSLQYYAALVSATNGLGAGVASGEVEIYGIVKIQKIK